MRLTMKLGLLLGLAALVAGSFALVRATAGTTGTRSLAANKAAVVLHAATPAVVPCADLRLLDFGALTELPVSISAAALNGTGAAEQCRVTGWIGQQTQFELRLPTTTWEGRYLQLGCGGTCGAIGFAVSPAGDTQLALTGNTFAVSATNEGHTSTGGWDVWAAGGKDNPLRVNYGYLANHQLAVVSKAIIGRFYAKAPTYSYFQGYSDGGRAAINEAQRYPDDFDGIIAGAPAIYTQESLTAAFIWRGVQGSKFDAASRQIIFNAAMAYCDPADGAIDNQISDPVNCHFDPGTIQCSATLTTNCLTPAQVDAARKQYDGARTDKGKLMHPGGQPEGSELTWPTSPGPLPSSYGRHIAFEHDPAPDWTWEDFEFTEKSYRDLQPMAKVYNSDNNKRPDLGAFRASGGKIIAWHGLADGSTQESSTLDWYGRVAREEGSIAETKSFARLFQVPGLYHGGGYINYNLSLLPKLIDWVEAGTAPEVVIATATTPVPRTYPVYVYPSRARFSGTGSVYDAANWTRQDPASEPDNRIDWLGGSGPKHPAPASPIPPAVVNATSQVISGTLADGTQWRVAKPTPWNGTLVLDLDGFGNASPTTPTAIQRWMIQHGFAIGGTQREPVGYEFPKAVDNLLTVRSAFIAQFGQPARTLTMGGSRGGFVSRLAIELHPDVFEGALLSAGGGAGEIATFNAHLDGLFALKTLVNPSAPIPLDHVVNPTAENAAINALVRQAMQTPQGRARLGLAAAFEQTPLWPNGPTSPAPGDAEGWINLVGGELNPVVGTVFGFANPAQVRQGIERAAGGNPFWNNGVNYASLLAQSGKADLVRDLYEAAGLNLQDDLKTLAKTPRINADPAAVATAEKKMTYTGEIRGPVMVVDNTGDPVDSDAYDRTYERTVTHAGNGKLLRTSWVASAGHANQSALELVTGFVKLIERLDTGKWSSTDPDDMTALSQDIAADAGFALGASRFVQNNPVNSTREWDVQDWGKYRPGS